MGTYPPIMSQAYSNELSRYAKIVDRVVLYGWHSVRSDGMKLCYFDADRKWREFIDLDDLEKALDDDRPAFIEREAATATGF
jgi:hypothetical protein